MIADNSKHPPGRSEEYLDYVRSLACGVCSERPTVAHHVMSAGVGQKGSDFSAIPLCRKHHREVHVKGWLHFEQEHTIVLHAVIAVVLVKWCDGKAKEWNDADITGE